MRRENGTKLKDFTFDLNLLLAPMRAHQVFICICFLVVGLFMLACFFRGCLMAQLVLGGWKRHGGASRWCFERVCCGAPMVTRLFSSAIGVSHMGGFRGRFYFLGRRWRKDFWSPLVGSTFGDGFWARVSIFFFSWGKWEAKLKLGGFWVWCCIILLFERGVCVALESRDFPLVQATTVKWFTEKPEWVIWVIWAMVGQCTDRVTQKCVKNESFCPCGDTLWLGWVGWFTWGFQCLVYYAVH